MRKYLVFFRNGVPMFVGLGGQTAIECRHASRGNRRCSPAVVNEMGVLGHRMVAESSRAGCRERAALGVWAFFRSMRVCVLASGVVVALGGQALSAGVGLPGDWEARRATTTDEFLDRLQRRSYWQCVCRGCRGRTRTSGTAGGREGLRRSSGGSDLGCLATSPCPSKGRCACCAGRTSIVCAGCTPHSLAVRSTRVVERPWRADCNPLSSHRGGSSPDGTKRSLWRARARR